MSYICWEHNCWPSPVLCLSVFRATATYRGQIIFKDALAQQLCEQGGEWQSGTTQISTFMPAPGASCTCRLICVFIGISTLCVQVQRCTCSYLPPPHFPLLSITCTERQRGQNNGDDVLILNDGSRAALLCSLLPPNDVAEPGKFGRPIPPA